MNDEELRAQLAEIRDLADRAMGEALSASLLIGPLLAMLTATKVLPPGGVEDLIDSTLLILEESDHPASGVERPGLRHARALLLAGLRTHAAVQPSKPAKRRRRPKPS